MGSGIAQTAAARGFNVVLYDLGVAPLEKARTAIAWSVDKLHGKRPDTWPESEKVLSRIEFVTEKQAAGTATFVIEAIAEKFSLKANLFEELHRICPKQAIFFTNTSAIPISKLAEASGRPENFCGLHFFSPVPLMQLVEVIRGLDSSEATIASAMQLARDLGKTPVLVEKDVPGFVVNRLLIGMTLEAIRLLESGVASAEDIDQAMKLGCGHKMGPLETADMSGLDIFLHAAEAIYQETANPQYLPPKLLVQMVAQGKLGKKSGDGFLLSSNRDE